MSSIFISHATEDKKDVAKPIADALRQRGYSVWYDEYALKLGDSLRRGIDGGLAKCTFGVVVLSKNFFSKHWPQRELDALTTREATEGGKIVLPVWHKISAKEISQFSPLLADKLGASTERGLDKVIQDICDVVGPPDNPRTSEGESNSLVFSFADQSILDWKLALQKLFPSTHPKSLSWIDRNEIVRILSEVAQSTSNHCFIPSGGGMDLVDVQASSEENCIELLWSPKFLVVVRPKMLRFENFPGFPSLSYFWLETDPLPLVGGLDEYEPNRMHDELVEVFPGDYRKRSVWDAGYYGHDEGGDEIPLPASARLVSRYSRGAFVLFAKGSIYNHLRGDHDAYFAQHEKMGAKKFRSFIAEIIQEATAKDLELEPDRRTPIVKAAVSTRCPIS